MVATSTVRIAGWGIGFVLSAGAFGMAWATQTLDVPLWAILVLTFVPTSDLIDAVRGLLDRLAANAEAKTK